MCCEECPGLPPQDRRQCSEHCLGTMGLFHQALPDTAPLCSAHTGFFSRKKCLRLSSFTDPCLSLPPSTHLTDQEEGFLPVPEGASRTQRGLQPCYQSRAPGRWAWGQSGGRKQEVPSLTHTSESGAYKVTSLARRGFHSTVPKGHMSARERPGSAGSL